MINDMKLARLTKIRHNCNNTRYVKVTHHTQNTLIINSVRLSIDEIIRGCCRLTANRILRNIAKRLIRSQRFAPAFGTFIITIPRAANSKDTHLRLSARRFATLGEKSNMSMVGHLGIGSQTTVIPNFLLGKQVKRI